MLEVSKYWNSHPGGVFLIEKNIGRDIGKYFDGGYQMENNRGLKPWTHTYQSRRIIERLAIGYLIGPAPTFEAQI